MDLIYREQAKEHLIKAYPLLQKEYLNKVIDSIPSARVKGKWINSYDFHGNHYKRCSECGTYIETTFFANDYFMNFCPNCGAEMEIE